MPYTPDERTVGIVADYCGFLREAAFVFSQLCKGPTVERREEFETLVGVEADSSVTYVALLHAVAYTSDQRWSREAGRLTRSLHATLGALVQAGATMLSSTVPERSPSVLRQCRQIEEATWAVDRSWQERRELPLTEKLLRSVQLEIIAWDRSLQSEETTPSAHSAIRMFEPLPTPLLR